MPQPPVHVLAFDTSTEQLAVGLHSPLRPQAELLAGPLTQKLTGPMTAQQTRPLTLVAAGGAAASATLLPHIQALLTRAGLVYADLDAIAFGAGPGAFTGLRTACAVAQGLGYGLGLRLWPLDSLLIVAEDARLQTAAGAGAGAFDVGVAMDARMDEVYAGRYRWSDGRWQVLQAPALYTLPALTQAWAGLSIDALAGSALSVWGDRLCLPPAHARFPRAHDRAAAQLRLAVQGVAAGAGIDAAAALPLYLRDKVALTTRERDAVRAAAVAAA